MTFHVISSWLMIVAALASIIIQLVRPRFEGGMAWIGLAAMGVVLAVGVHNLIWS